MEGAIDLEIARIGERIRRWREEAGFTLQQLAERSALATSTVQKVETGQMIPSVAVLLKLARGLGRRATELIHDGAYDQDVLHLPAASRSEFGVRDHMTVERLSADLAEPTLEMWRITLHPGTSSGRDTIQYTGEALIVCEKGRVTVRVGPDDYRLETGDTLHFKASIPHSWRNDSRGAARFTVTGTLPRQLRMAIQRRAAAGSETGGVRGEGARSTRV